MTAVMSAANEKAVEVFLAERIRYLDIVPLVSACCEAHQQARNSPCSAFLQSSGEECKQEAHCQRACSFDAKWCALLSKSDMFLQSRKQRHTLLACTLTKLGHACK